MTSLWCSILICSLIDSSRHCNKLWDYKDENKLSPHFKGDKNINQWSVKKVSLKEITFELCFIRSEGITQNIGEAQSPNRRDTQEYLVKITLYLRAFTLKIKLLLGSWGFFFLSSSIAGFKGWCK